MNNVAKHRNEVKAHIKRCIKEKGFAILANQGKITPGSQPINYAYTVGMRDLGLPELIMVGIPSTDTLSRIIHNQAREWISVDKASFTERDDLTHQPNMRTKTIRVDSVGACKLYCEELRRHYPRRSITMAQILFPDNNNLLPGEVGYNDDYDQGYLIPFSTAPSVVKHETHFDVEGKFESIVATCGKLVDCKFSQPKIVDDVTQLLFSHDGLLTVLSVSLDIRTLSNYVLFDQVCDNVAREYLANVKKVEYSKPNLIGSTILKWEGRDHNTETLVIHFAESRSPVPLLEIETTDMGKVVHMINQDLQGLRIDPIVIQSLIDSIPTRN